jgi:hypothetical protein
MAVLPWLAQTGLRTAGAVGRGLIAGGIGRRAALGGAMGGVVGIGNASRFDSPTMQAGAIGKGALLGAAAGAAIGGMGAGFRLNQAMGRRALFRVKPEMGIEWQGLSTARELLRAGRPSGWRDKAGRMATGAEIRLKRFGIQAEAFGVSPLARGIDEFLGNVGGTAIGAAKMVPGAAALAARQPGTVLGGVALGAAGIYGVGKMTGPEPSPTLSGAIVNTDYARQEGGISALQQTNIAPTGRVGTYPTMMGPMQKAFQRSTQGLVGGLHRGRHG